MPYVSPLGKDIRFWVSGNYTPPHWSGVALDALVRRLFLYETAASVDGALVMPALIASTDTCALLIEDVTYLLIRNAHGFLREVEESWETDDAPHCLARPAMSAEQVRHGEGAYNTMVIEDADSAGCVDSKLEPHTVKRGTPFGIVSGEISAYQKR